MILSWLGEVAGLAKEFVRLLFPTAEERELSRREKAKENWDKFREEEKKARETLYPNRTNKH